MPLPPIYTTNLVGYWHPARVNRFKPPHLIDGTVTSWDGIIGESLIANKDFRYYVVGSGTSSDPYRLVIPLGDSLYFTRPTTIPFYQRNEGISLAVRMWFSVKQSDIGSNGCGLFTVKGLTNGVTGGAYISQSGNLVVGNVVLSISSYLDGNPHLLTISFVSSSGVFCYAYLDESTLLSGASTGFGSTGNLALVNLLKFNNSYFVGTLYSVSLYHSGSNLYAAGHSTDYTAGFMLSEYSVLATGNYLDINTVLNQGIGNTLYLALIKSDYSVTDKLLLPSSAFYNSDNSIFIDINPSTFFTSYPVDIIGINLYGGDNKLILTSYIRKHTITSNQQQLSLRIRFKSR